MASPLCEWYLSLLVALAEALVYAGWILSDMCVLRLAACRLPSSLVLPGDGYGRGYQVNCGGRRTYTWGGASPVSPQLLGCRAPPGTPLGAGGLIVLKSPGISQQPFLRGIISRVGGAVPVLSCASPIQPAPPWPRARSCPHLQLHLVWALPQPFRGCETSEALSTPFSIQGALSGHSCSRARTDVSRSFHDRQPRSPE